MQLGPPRLVLVNQSALNAVEVDIELEPGLTVTYRRAKPLTPSYGGGWSWAGNDRSALSIAILSSSADGRFHATILFEGMAYTVRMVEGEVYGVYTMDVSKLPVGEGAGGPLSVPPPSAN